MRCALASLLALASALADKTACAGSLYRHLSVSAIIGCNVYTACEFTQDCNRQVVHTCQKPPQILASMMSPSLRGEPRAPWRSMSSCFSFAPARRTAVLPALLQGISTYA